MPIYFKPMYIKKPGNPETGKYYAKEINFGMIETSRIAEIVAKRSGHSVGQVIGFFQDYYRRIENHIISGNNVSMHPLGTIMPAFASLGVKTLEEVKLNNLKKINVNFRTSAILRRKMQPKNLAIRPGEVELKLWK